MWSLLFRSKNADIFTLDGWVQKLLLLKMQQVLIVVKSSQVFVLYYLSFSSFNLILVCTRKHREIIHLFSIATSGKLSLKKASPKEDLLSQDHFFSSLLCTLFASTIDSLLLNCKCLFCQEYPSLLLAAKKKLIVTNLHKFKLTCLLRHPSHLLRPLMINVIDKRALVVNYLARLPPEPTVSCIIYGISRIEFKP